MIYNFQNRPRGAGKVAAGKQWLDANTITAHTITADYVPLETVSLLSGVRLLDLIDTPQNRDARRRATLAHGPSTPIEDAMKVRGNIKGTPDE